MLKQEKFKKKNQKNLLLFLNLFVILILIRLLYLFIYFCNLCDVLGYWSTKYFCFPKKAFLYLEKVFRVPKKKYSQKKAFWAQKKVAPFTFSSIMRVKSVAIDTLTILFGFTARHDEAATDP